MLSSSAAGLPPVSATAVSQSGNMIHVRPQTADHTVRPAATWVVWVASCVGVGLSLVGCKAASLEHGKSVRWKIDVGGWYHFILLLLS